MTVIVDGLPVTYNRSGKGKTVVFLHGWGDSSTTFKSITSNLGGTYEIISLDLPGFGGTGAPKEPFTLQKYAAFVAHFLTKIGAQDVYAFVGHSNGGAIAIKGLADGILQASRLVLLASAGVRSTYKGRKKALRLAAKAAKMPVMLLPKGVQRTIKKKAYRTIGSDMFVAEHLQDTFRQVVEEDLLDTVQGVQIPTLLLYGDQDTATPVSHGQAFDKRLPYSNLVIVGDAGHFLHQTHSQIVLEKLREFLS